MTTKSDTKVWDELRKKLRELGASDMHVNVGVFGDGGGEGDIGIVQLATIHEFGAPKAGIPERSFIRFTGRERRADLTNVMAKLAKDIVEDNKTPHQAYDILGAWYAAAIKKSIKTKAIYQNLKPATIARKGSDTALIDTGRLWNAITWKVVE